jgi:hypothetical protein
MLVCSSGSRGLFNIYRTVYCLPRYGHRYEPDSGIGHRREDAYTSNHNSFKTVVIVLILLLVSWLLLISIGYKLNSHKFSSCECTESSSCSVFFSSDSQCEYSVFTHTQLIPSVVVDSYDRMCF